LLVSVDKEAAGTVAGLMEKISVVKNRDRRTYQDGIYIIEKGVQDE
jgi:ribosomal protein L6P/L9E